MHVVERFTREGDALLYDVTVEDPEVLAEPWVLPTRMVRRNPNPNAGLIPERGNCEVYETKDISSQIRHVDACRTHSCMPRPHSWGC